MSKARRAALFFPKTTRRFTRSFAALFVAGIMALASCATQDKAQMAQKMRPGTVKMLLPSFIRSGERALKKNPGEWKQSLETGSYCVMYANAFIQSPASMLPASDYQKRDREFRRAKAEYLRGVAILRAALDRKYPGLNGAFGKPDFPRFLAAFTKDDVEMLYWTTAGSLAAFSVDPLDMALGLKLPELTAFIQRAYELNPDFNDGALDDFFILFYGALPPEMGGDRVKAKRHYELALQKAAGRAASPYVSWAQTICIPEQNYEEFKKNLDAALAIDPKAYLPLRLNNIIAQRMARYLLATAEYKFISLE